MAITDVARAPRQQQSALERSREDGRQRVVIENVQPCIDSGRFPAKRIVGEDVFVTADVFTDGHDLIRCILSYQHENDRHWRHTPQHALINDAWRGRFVVEKLGVYRFTLTAFIDRFGTWRRDLTRKFEAGQDVSLELMAGAELVEEAMELADGSDRDALHRALELLRSGETTQRRVSTAVDRHLADLMDDYAPRRHETRMERPVEIFVDRERARFSTWYELFPRSTSPEPGRHGTFKDVEARLPYVASMGFDVLYLPPIHPIGATYRKGKNNALSAQPDDVGSPWAIGSSEGGHKSVHPDLGTLEDFGHLVAAAHEHGLEIALDIAYQCSPDHPYVREHSEWFRRRPDGSIQYAENPPKKYQDIYPFDFESEQWESLWKELKSIFDFWIEHGVRIFRVDNPHTKPFAFWEWAIGEVRREHPEVIFLSEAFTRPKVMYRLAKAGFTQSYTYFAWRNDPWELREYLQELTQAPVVEYFRANAWPNTPDILTEYLQHGGRPASVIRLILAATLCGNYGVYGPAFELVEVAPRELRSEEYLDSEKYQIRDRDLDQPHSLRELIARINRIRRSNPALQQDRTLHFHHCDNPAMICYSKTSPDRRNIILCVVNTNAYGPEESIVRLNLALLGIEPEAHYQVHDLLTDAYYIWRGADNFVRLDPGVIGGHIFQVRRRLRSEQDFEYYL